MQAVKQKEAVIYEGITHSIHLPDGSIAKIRETNGDDDAVLSNASDSEDNSHVHNFLAGITISIDEQTSLSPDDIRKWKNNNKYYLLLKQRIINHGSEFIFKINCSNEKCGKETEFTEDLTQIDSDLSQQIARDPNNPNKVWSYLNGKETTIEFTISTGKKFQAQAMTAQGESILRSIANNKVDKNTQLLIRELKQWDDKKYTLVTFFKGLSSKEMSEIRSFLDKVDSQFNPMVISTCPYCSNKEVRNLFHLPTFFFPE